MFDIEVIVRENIKGLKPYSSARHEFKGEALVFLDANENSYGSPLPQNFNRYPDAFQVELKKRISTLKGIPAANIFLGNGSDEAIDLLIRLFCVPGKDSIVVCPPTYGMYEVSAAVNDVNVVGVPLKENFELNTEVLQQQFINAPLLFLCSPNNPTGNAHSQAALESILQTFKGVVVVDEAYMDYSSQPSAVQLLSKYENVVVLQTFSKAWGLAGLRLGVAFASEKVIGYMNKIKPPYNVSELTQTLVLQAIDNEAWVKARVAQVKQERDRLTDELSVLPVVARVFPSDANFVLVKVYEAAKVYSYLINAGIVVRNRSNVVLCDECLRITIGTLEQNNMLIDKLKKFNP